MQEVETSAVHGLVGGGYTGDASVVDTMGVMNVVHRADERWGVGEHVGQRKSRQLP